MSKAGKGPGEMKRALIITLLVIVLAVGGYFGYTRYQKSQAEAQSNFQTVTLANGDLTATVGATGAVRSNQKTTVSWQTSGRVGKIDVKVGDKVSINQALAELDPASLPQNIILANSDLVSAQRDLKNLLDSNTARAQAQQALADAQKALSDAQINRYKLSQSRVSQATIDQTQAQLVIDQDALKRAQDNYNQFASRPEDDVMRAQAFDKLAAAQQAVQTDQINLDWMTGHPNDNDVQQSDAAVKVAQAKVADAQREWDRLKNGVDPKDIAAAQAKVDAIQATLALAQIKAPISGTITNVNNLVGDQVAPGLVSFQIDDLSRMLVDVQITEVDIDRVKSGQSANISFDAVSNTNYSGKVTEVSSFGTNQSGVVNFTVTVELTNADPQVRPGMTAAVNLTVEQLHNVLLVPNRAVRLQGGKRVLYLLENGQPKTQEITIGATSDTYSQITSGNVKAGDRVILNPPLLLPGGPGGGFGGFGR
jgi:HlyD family secretion protein